MCDTHIVTRLLKPEADLVVAQDLENAARVVIGVGLLVCHTEIAQRVDSAGELGGGYV